MVSDYKGLQPQTNMDDILRQLFRVILPTVTTENLYLRHIVFGLLTNYNHVTSTTAPLFYSEACSSMLYIIHGMWIYPRFVANPVRLIIEMSLILVFHSFAAFYVELHRV